MSEQPIKIRQARLTDGDWLYKTVVAAQDEIPLRRADVESPQFLMRLALLCRDRQMWVAEIGGALAGFFALDGTRIFWLVTAKEYRGRGVGRALVRRAVKVIKRRHGCGAGALAWDKNTVVRKLFESEGFQIDTYEQTRPRTDGRPNFVPYILGELTLEQRQI